jgi:hypothetical protein
MKRATAFGGCALGRRERGGAGRIAPLLLGTCAALGWAFAVWGCTPLATPGKVPDPGKTAPGFTLPSHTGDEVSLAELRKRGKVVLVFYRGHW